MLLAIYFVEDMSQNIVFYDVAENVTVLGKARAAVRHSNDVTTYKMYAWMINWYASERVVHKITSIKERETFMKMGHFQNVFLCVFLWVFVILNQWNDSIIQAEFRLISIYDRFLAQIFHHSIYCLKHWIFFQMLACQSSIMPYTRNNQISTFTACHC